MKKLEWVDYFPGKSSPTFKYKNEKAVEIEKSESIGKHIADDDDDDDYVSRKFVAKRKSLRLTKTGGIDPENGGVKRGTKVDLKSLLTSSDRDYVVDSNGNEVKASKLEGKYIIIHHFELPVNSYHTEGVACWALKHALSRPLWLNNVRFVAVPTISHSYSYKHDAELLFKSFLCGFPCCSALAVPISDSASCHRVSGFLNPYHCIILDSNSIILELSSHCLFQYGALAFPFTSRRLNTLHKTVYDLAHNRPVLLENLLGLSLSHSLVNFAANRSVLVSDLKQKLVGLYLCRDGHDLDVVHQAYTKCHAKNLEFEIVLVYLPFSDEPSHFITCANAALRDKQISSWWLLPFNDSTSRKLWSLCRLTYRDELIIVGPRGQFIDTKAISIFTYWHVDKAINDMYPYAAEFIARQETDRLNKLTLDSLLCSSPINCLRPATPNARPRITSSDLQGKIVCLFIVNFDHKQSDEMLQFMAHWCSENNKGVKDYSNFVLVFIPIYSKNQKFSQILSNPRLSWLRDSTMSWLVCPPNRDRKISIIKHTALRGLSFRKLDKASFVFGKEGSVMSMGYPRLSQIEANGFPPDNLYEEVIDQYYEHFDYRRSVITYC